VAATEDKPSESESSPTPSKLPKTEPCSAPTVPATTQTKSSEPCPAHEANHGEPKMSHRSRSQTETRVVRLHSLPGGTSTSRIGVSPPSPQYLLNPFVWLRDLGSAQGSGPGQDQLVFVSPSHTPVTDGSRVLSRSACTSDSMAPRSVVSRSL
jgi:hypothetical protein